MSSSADQDASCPTGMCPLSRPRGLLIIGAVLVVLLGYRWYAQPRVEAMPPGSPVVVVLSDFDREVLTASHQHPVLVEFGATWCPPCKALAPLLEGVARDYQSRLSVVSVDVDLHQDIAHKLEISSIPDVRLYRDGAVVAGFVGFRDQAQLHQWLDANLQPRKDIP